MKSTSPLDALGKRMADTQDRELADRPAPKTKERLLASPSKRSPRAGWLYAAIAACFCLIAIFFWLRSEPAALRATLPNGDQAETGRWIGATHEPIELSFSDGTEVVLAPGASARIASVDSRGARVVVERGFVDVAVVHAEGTNWWFDVGPFAVHVTGTRFRAGWEPESGQLTLELTEGSVTVSGPVIGEERAVSKGEALRVSVDEARMELTNAPPKIEPAPSTTAVAVDTPAASSADAAATSPTSQETTAAPVVSGSPRTIPTTEPSAAVASTPSWSALARAGKYKEALARAEADGLDSILESASADELALLADVARLAGNGDKATAILKTQRRRFKGDPKAAAAAFMLGRAAFDNQKAYASAAKWFATYLEEQPKGTFAREALGRLAEARHLAGDEAGARSAARSYLSAYPEGPHAAVARSILAK